MAELYIQVTEKIELESTRDRKYIRLLHISDNYLKYVLRTDKFAIK